MSIARSLAATWLFVPLLAACGCAPARGVRVEDAWVRAAESGGTTAAYFALVNDGSDSLHVTGVAGDCASSIAMHQTVRENGMVGMREASGFDVPPHGRLLLQPGGNHVMLVGLKQQLLPGRAAHLSLHLRSRPDLPIVAEIRP